MRLSESMQRFVNDGWGSPKVQRWVNEAIKLEATNADLLEALDK